MICQSMPSQQAKACQSSNHSIAQLLFCSHIGEEKESDTEYAKIICNAIKGIFGVNGISYR